METREEIHCIRNNGSTARVDILAWNAVSNKGYILDPTVRLETSIEQPTEVDNEKKSIYEPTLSYFKDKFHLEEIKVYGLLIGSRRTIPRLVANFLRQLGLTSNTLEEIAITAVKGSWRILNNHLHNHIAL